MGSAPIRYKLRTWRQLNQLSQAAAAEKLGVARRTWHQWEQAAVIPGPDHMAKLHDLTTGFVEPNDFYDLPPPSDRQAA